MSDVGLPGEKWRFICRILMLFPGWVIMTNSTYILPVEGNERTEAMKFAVSMVLLVSTVIKMCLKHQNDLKRK